jgi:hypothetical protein
MHYMLGIIPLHLSRPGTQLFKRCVLSNAQRVDCAVLGSFGSGYVMLSVLWDLWCHSPSKINHHIEHACSTREWLSFVVLACMSHDPPLHFTVVLQRLGRQWR